MIYWKEQDHPIQSILYANVKQYLNWGLLMKARIFFQSFPPLHSIWRKDIIIHKLMRFLQCYIVVMPLYNLKKSYLLLMISILSFEPYPYQYEINSGENLKLRAISSHMITINRRKNINQNVSDDIIYFKPKYLTLEWYII